VAGLNGLSENIFFDKFNLKFFNNGSVGIQEMLSFCDVPCTEKKNNIVLTFCYPRNGAD
jgi:hypothetical protein